MTALKPVDVFEPLLPGIGFSGFRSFPEWQEFLFPTKVTVLAGVNNSGKSNVLRFLQHILPKVNSNKNDSARPPACPQLDGLDRPRGFENDTILEIGIPIRLGSFAARQAPRSTMAK